MSCNCQRVIKLPNGSHRRISCGYCQGCRISKVVSWSIRANLEVQKASFAGYSSTFVGLSYEDSKLPLAPTYNIKTKEINYAGVQKKHVQNFFKLLRQKRDRKNANISPDFKYLCASEYAPETMRPHYHVVLCGIGQSNSKVIQESWPYGWTETLPLLQGGVRYTLKYLDKCRTQRDDTEYFHSRGLNPPFFTQSQGFGFDFFLSHIDDIDPVTRSIKYGSAEIAVPSSFLDKYGIFASKSKPPVKLQTPYQKLARELFLISKARNHGEAIECVDVTSNAHEHYYGYTRGKSPDDIVNSIIEEMEI